MNLTSTRPAILGGSFVLATGPAVAYKPKDGLPHSEGWFGPDYRIPGDGSTAF